MKHTTSDDAGIYIVLHNDLRIGVYVCQCLSIDTAHTYALMRTYEGIDENTHSPSIVRKNPFVT